MRKDAVFQLSSSAVERIQNRLAVQGFLHGLADLDIAHGLDVLIQGDVVDADTRSLDDLVLVLVAAEKIVCLARRVVEIQDVQFSILKHHALRLLVGDNLDVESVAGGSTGPAVLVRGQDQLGVERPGAEDERAGSDRDRGIDAELIAGGFGRVLVENGGTRHGQLGKERGIGLGEGDREIQVVDRLESADVLEGVCLCVLKLVCAQDSLCDVVVHSLGIGEETVEGVEYIGRGQIGAVRVLDALI